jgi:DNA transposition AAA+ family ATPase
MSDAPPLVKPRRHAAIKNIAGCYNLVLRLQQRGGQDTNIGVMHGHSGVGKSQSSILAQNKFGAIRIKVGESWNKKTLVESILQELGVNNPVGSTARLVRDAIRRLSDDPNRPLFIDEADKLILNNAIEIVREIADDANIPVLLIGEEMLPQKLAKIERVHNRILGWFPAQFCDAEDARLLADLFVPNVSINDDLLEKARIDGGGRIRRIVSSLAEMREFSRNTGLKALDIGNYNGSISTGRQPAPRSGRLDGRAA